MGVKPVDFGDGRGAVPIDSSNAKEALKRRSELNLDTAQVKWAEKFLSEDEKDEIFYSENESKTRGQEAINTDADGDGEADTDKSAGGGSGAALGGSIAGCVGGILAACAAATANGIVALIGAGLAVAGAGIALTFSFPTMFDDAYDARETFSGESEANVETMNTANDDLVDSMDSMTEDAETYAEQSNIYTVTVNDAVSEKAELEGRLAKIDPSDTEGKTEIEDRLKELEEEDNSEMIAGMDETKENMEEYSSKNAEALGMVESGTAVADFLKVGHSLSKKAMASAILLTLGASIITITSSIAAIPKLPFFADAAPAAASKIIFMVAAGMMGFAATKMFSNESKEGEFGDNGDAMGAAASDLSSMSEQQQEFIDSTNEGFDATDQKSTDSQAEAVEAANKAKQVMQGGPQLNPDADGGIYKDEKAEEKGGQQTQTA